MEGKFGSLVSRVRSHLANMFARTKRQQEREELIPDKPQVDHDTYQMHDKESNRTGKATAWCHSFMARQRFIVPEVSPISIYYATQKPKKRRKLR